MSNMTNWLLAIIIVLLFGGGIYWIYSNQSPDYATNTGSTTTSDTTGDTTSQNLPSLTEPVNDEDHKLGPDDAAVVLVEYSDFQCPACQQMGPMFASMVDKFPGKVQLVHRHFPLDFHELAADAAKIAEAASTEGKFFDVADYYFANPSFTLEGTYTHLNDLGLDGEMIKTEVENGDYDAAVNADIASGGASGVSGTPTLYMNGTQLSWEHTIDLENTIKAELGE